MARELRTALAMLVAMTVVTGVAYPLFVTGVARLAFPAQAAGSLIEVDGVARGSRLIGQSFDDPRFFWGRPSATTAVPYDAAASAGSNLGPTNPVLAAAVRARVEALREQPGGGVAIPVDLVTASGSGLDPHISPAAARFQIPRVAAARNLEAARLAELVESRVEGRAFGLLGEPRVNVLLLNLDLERLR